MKYTIREFAQEIRNLYFGDYDDMSDQELVNKWLTKYPGDKEKVDLDQRSQSQIRQKHEVRKPHDNKYSGLSDELSMSVHKSKTFVLPAILTLVLYYIGFFIIGFIVNLIYLSSANNNRRLTGINPPGRGFLVFLLIFHLILLGIFIILLVLGINLLSYLL